jgi:deazaflavin-dependent oxidoreductase (nitroreductase family)
VDRVFNRLFGAFVALGLGLPHNVLLETRGRKTGRVYSTPVNVLALDDRRYLVAPRGATAWVRNAHASGTVTLRRGRRREEFRVRWLSAAFRPLVDRYPALELLPAR